MMEGDAATISIESAPPEEQTTEEKATRQEFCPPVLKLRTDIFKKGVFNGPPIKLSRNFTPPQIADSGFLEFSEILPNSLPLDTSDPLILVKEQEEGELDISLSSSNAETSFSSDGFLTNSAISSTSTPRQSADNINSEDGEDLRRVLARKRKFDSDDQISFLSHRIEEKQETIREIERISKMKISELEKEIAADKSEIDRISNREPEGGVQNKVSEKRMEVEFPVKKKKPSKYYDYYCDLCDVKANSSHVWNQHLSGRRHKESLEKLTLAGIEDQRDLRGWLTRK